MPKILIIGEELSNRNFDLLSKHGEVARFKSINTVRLRTEEPVDLLIVEKDQYRERSFKDFIKTFFSTPKIIIGLDGSYRGFSPWLRYPLTHTAHNPHEKELIHLINRLLSERALQAEYRSLKAEVLHSRKELAFFDEIGKTLTSDMELDVMLSGIMKKIKTMVNASSWSIFLIDEETGDLVLEKTDRGKKHDKAVKPKLKVGEGIAGWVAKEGIPLIVPDVSQDEGKILSLPLEGASKSRSVMCIPVKSRDRVVGVLELASKAVGTPFTKNDLTIMTKIMSYAALAVERSALYHKMAELAITDDLTKLFNSRYLNRTIEVEIHRCERSHTSVSLIFMDIDYFKQVNDSYGHLVGSKILVEVGQLLIRNLRSIDIVARYGGDEFVVVLPQTTPQVAAKVAERIRKTIEQNIFMKKEGYGIRITASFGVASYPESSKTKEELLKLADEAMYRVKNNTRNGVYAIM